MKKINIAELLKDCPKGMELYSPIFGKVYLDKVRPHLAIVVIIDKGQGDFKEEFLYDGRYGMNGECMLYPSKSKTTWEGFVPPCKFKDGDILVNKRGSMFIYKGPMCYNKNFADFYCGYRISDNAFILKKFKDNHFGDVNELRLASEIEKQHFFQILSNNGYKWNPETKTLKKLIKPKFKIGDKIKLKNSPSNLISTVTKINDDGSICVNDYTWVIKYELQDKYELIPNKFDINTLVPFESRVLVRDCNLHEWEGDIFTRYTNNSFNNCNFVTLGGLRWKQCIPFKENEHLLGTANDCDEYYKNW